MHAFKKTKKSHKNSFFSFKDYAEKGDSQEEKIDPDHETNLEKYIETGQNRADIAYGGAISSDCALNYENKFGKVYKGERVAIMFSIYNTS